MLPYLPFVGMFSALAVVVCAAPLWNDAVHRASRAEFAHPFHPLGSLQFDDYELPPEVEAHERDSFKFMETPMVLSNPVWNVVSKISDIYRWASGNPVRSLYHSRNHDRIHQDIPNV